MGHNMSEKYVKEILEKLEEIEKLHSKLRNLVHRAKNCKKESDRNTNMNKSSTSLADKNSIVNETNENKIHLPEQEPVHRHRDSVFRNNYGNSAVKEKGIFNWNNSPMTYLKKFKERSNNGFKRLKSNSVDYVTKQWKDKNGKIKDLLLSINDPDIILISRAVQTAEGEVNIISEPFQRRRNTMEDISKWLLEHFNNFHNFNRMHENRIYIDGCGLGDNQPRRVHKTLFIPDKEIETLKIILNARRISMTENRRLSSLNKRIRKLSKTFSSINLEN